MISPTNFDGKISIITAVYNAENCINSLIDSLRNQTDQNFEWIVVDGLSTDNTVEILKKVDDLTLKIISEADFGIYDALNKGVKACGGQYYLVAGADDVFYPNAIDDYKTAIKPHTDMITASVKMGTSIITIQKPSWRYGARAFISNHSVGVLIKKDLHRQYGFYSRKFPIVADSLFIKQCCQHGATVDVIDKLVGDFGVAGCSTVDKFGGCTEIFRVQLLTGENKWVQYIILMLKLALNLFKFNK